jgi:glycerol-3-phosphate acyltransferase PlsY
VDCGLIITLVSKKNANSFRRKNWEKTAVCIVVITSTPAVSRQFACKLNIGPVRAVTLIFKSAYLGTYLLALEAWSQSYDFCIYNYNASVVLGHINSVFFKVEETNSVSKTHYILRLLVMLYIFTALAL